MPELKEIIKKLPKSKQEEIQNAFNYELKLAKGEISTGQYKWIDPDDHLKGIDLGEGLKDLPRDEEGNYLKKFKTEKHTYRILSLDEISGENWHIFKKISISGGLGKSFKEIIDHIDNITKRVLSAGIGEMNLKNVMPELSKDIVIMNQAFKDGIRDLTKMKFDAIYLAVSCFVVREGMDARKWSEDYAEEIVNDMMAYGYVNMVFFSLFATRLNSFPGIWNDLILKKPASEAEMAKLSGAGRITETLTNEEEE